MQEIKRVYWKMKDVQKEIGQVSQSCIRHWATESKMVVKTNKKGDRYFNADQVEFFRKCLKYRNHKYTELIKELKP